MTASAFVDSNILLYAISTNPAESAKREIAATVLRREDIAFSCQVFQEFYANATKGPPSPVSNELATSIVDALAAWPVQEITLALVLRAFILRVQYQLSYWDAAIVAAAQALGCKTLLSEDFQEGRDFDGLIVVNPFRT